MWLRYRLYLSGRRLFATRSQEAERPSFASRGYCVFVHVCFTTFIDSGLFVVRGASHTTVVCAHVFYGLDQRLFGLAGSIPPPGAAARTQVGVLSTAMMRIAESFFAEPSLMLRLLLILPLCQWVVYLA